jgi:hypothetical protein
MPLRHSGNMVLSRVFISLYEDFSDAILGEGTDTIRYLKNMDTDSTTRKTTPKTTNHTTRIRQKPTTFVSG